MADIQEWDVPLEEGVTITGEGEWDMPVITTETKSENLRREEAMLLTAAESGLLPESNAVEAFKMNYERLAMADAEVLAQNITGAYVADELAVANEVAPVAPEAASEYMALRSTELAQPDSLHRMAMETISQSDDIFTQAEIARSYAAYSIAQMVESTSKGEDIANFLSDVFLPVASKDRNDFLNEVYGDDIELSFREAVVDFASQTPEKRAAMLPAMMEAALEATDGNEARAGRLLQELYGITEEASTSDLIFDGLIVAPALFSGMVKAAKASRFVATAARLNKDEAAQIVAASTVDPEVAQATGITQRTAAESTSPFNWSAVSADAVDGIEPNVVKAFDEARAEIQTAVRSTEESLIKRSPLTIEEQKAAQVKAMAEFEKQSAKLNKENGWAATNARVTSTDEFGFTVEYDLVDAAGNPLQAKPHRVNYTKNDVGEYEPFKVGPLESRLNSPSVWANRAQENVVELATAIGFSNERQLQKLMGIANDSIKGLKKAEVDRLDAVLIAGDEFKDASGAVVGKVFTPKELMLDGIPGVGRLTQKEAESYYKMRTFWDEIHRVSEHQVLRQWNFEGVRTVGTFADEKIFGNLISAGQLPNSVKKVVNLETKTVDDLAGIQARIEKGELELVKFRRNIDMGDEIYEFGVIRKGSTKSLPTSGVLPKKTGYVPLIRKDAYYFVEAQTQRMINGSKGSVPQVVRAFDNQTDAARWAAEQEAKTGVKHTARYDREVSSDIKSDLQQSQFGKPVFGSRVQDREILFGYNGTKPERMDAIEALQRNINAISNSMPMNEFRMAQVQKWLNSANPYLIEPGNFRSGFKATEANSKVASLEAMRKWLDDQFHMPTTSEQVFSGSMRNFAEFLEGNRLFKDGALSGVRKGIHEAGGVDIFGAARGAAFHTLLGWWNPAQFLVQAAGASLAISLNPAKFPKIMRDYSILRAGYNLSDEGLSKMATMLGRNAEEMLSLRAAYRRSGIVESLKTTADYNAAGLGYGIDAGAVQRTWGNLKEGNLVFFREGERFNRTYSWLLAADDYMALNKIPAGKLKDYDIDEITKRSLKYTMNMNRANRADWQKGIISVPTQFWQVNAKFLETVGPRVLGSNGAFTGKQKAAIIGGQLALFGSAGVPLGDALTRGFVDYAGLQMGDLSEEQIAAIRQGAVGLAMQSMIGEEIEVSERFAFGSGFNQLLETFTAGDKTFGQIALGAAGALPTRVFQALSAIAPRFEDPEFSQSEAQAVGVEFANIISTFRNAHKAYVFATLGEMRTADGTVIDHVNWGEDFKMIVAQGLGFAPSRVADYYDHKKYQQNMNQIRSDALRALEKNYVQFLSGDITDERWQERYNQLNSLIMNSIQGPMEQEKLRDAWSKKMTQDPQLQKLMNSTIETYFGSGVLQPKTIGGGAPLSILKEVQ